MTISQADYVVELRSADGRRIGVKVTPANAQDEYAIVARTADSFRSAIKVVPLSSMGDIGISGLSADAQRLGLKFVSTLAEDEPFVAIVRSGTIYAYNQALALLWSHAIGAEACYMNPVGIIYVAAGVNQYKYAKNGTVIWSISPGFGSIAVTETSQGDSVWGGSPGGVATETVMKLTVEGVEVWRKTVGTPPNYSGPLGKDSLGNVWTHGPSPISGKQAWKIDADGIEQASLDGSVGTGAAVDEYDNAYIVGLRYNEASIWKVGGWSYDTGSATYAVGAGTAGRICVGGAVTGGHTVWVFDIIGNLVWDYNTVASVYAIDLDADGNVYAAGNTVAGINFWKLSPTGILLASKLIGTWSWGHVESVSVRKL